MKSPQERSVDPAAVEMLQHAAAQKLPVAWDRFEAMQPQCGFGILGVCCRNCTMGPCRIDPFGQGASEGICGADADIIAARNLVRMIAAGSSAHSDHGRDVTHAVLIASEGGDYGIKDETKLRALAKEWGIAAENKTARQIAHEVANIAQSQFGQQEGELRFVARAPKLTQDRWRKAKVVPRGIDREVVDLLHRTHIGGDNDFRSLIMAGVRTALADGWGGSMIATELSDIIFNSPAWIRARVNLGVIEPKNVNIVVHGHEPVLSDMIVAASHDKELQALARSNGAEGITLSGICCTANEILMRHGIPVAGNFLHQELAIATGAVDAMVVDIQCVMPALGKLAQCFHTKFISTSKKAQFPFAQHIEFDEGNALNIAKQIIRTAIENFPNRDKSRVTVPKITSPLVAGFTAENVFTALGGRYRPSYRPLNDAIITGRLRGVAAVVGCNNPRHQQDQGHLAMTRELLANDVLVATTGCTAIADAKAGLLCPEAAEQYAGEGLKEICRAVGIPPVLHFGACVDISRILVVLSNMVAEGGMGESLADIPAAAAAPEWMSEKAVAIGFYAVASGAYTVLGGPLPVQGAAKLNKFLTQDIAEIFGGKFAFQDDPVKAARLMLDHIDQRREALHLPGPMYQVPYAPRTAEAAVAAAG
ncbi:MAG: anaerobic carbon-monoxide dehydrogenase catalytic subunit [Planctomycetes bacterium]|nr:anaerobic carbon-monoxide dehydrogenase catalytic subunit [Planctomycetota bacterium]